ncbi:MAG: OmpA family protein [bacterium]|nr:OmpA family protein [bacterium]
MAGRKLPSAPPGEQFGRQVFRPTDADPGAGSQRSAHAAGGLRAGPAGFGRTARDGAGSPARCRAAVDRSCQPGPGSGGSGPPGPAPRGSRGRWQRPAPVAARPDPLGQGGIRHGGVPAVHRSIRGPARRRAGRPPRRGPEGGRSGPADHGEFAAAERAGGPAWPRSGRTRKLRDGEQALADAAAKHDEQGRQLKAQSEELDTTRAALAASEKAGQKSSTDLAAAQTARLSAEKSAADAKAELTKLAGVKDTARGQVFTLSGGLIFRTNEATLMPGAERQLDQLVQALASSPDRLVVVEGYTDSQGSADHNLDLSQRRADAVRDYLMIKGYSADQVRARGVGEESPIADNGTSEGRANNRRVEIVLGDVQD